MFLESFRRSNDVSPIRGINSLVAGIDSAMSNINTENERSTVKPNDTFSPDSVGK